MIMTSNPNHDISINDSFQTSHAIDRSGELLSVARTALSILDQEQRQRQQEQYQHQYEEKTKIQYILGLIVIRSSGFSKIYKFLLFFILILNT